MKGLKKIDLIVVLKSQQPHFMILRSKAFLQSSVLSVVFFSILHSMRSLQNVSIVSLCSDVYNELDHVTLYIC